MNTFFSITFETIVILALVFANGFFVAAEFSLVKIRLSQLRPLEKQGGLRVRLAIKAAEHLDAVLSATQLGITLTSLGLGWLGEPFVAHRIRPVLHWVGITDEAAVSSTSVLIGFSLITFLHIVLGELAPKSLAIQRPKQTSLLTAGPLIAFYYLLYPAIFLLNGTANLFLRWAGLRPASEGEHSFTAEELEHVLSHAHHSHPGDALVNKLMVQSLRLRATDAGQIMRPRDQVFALWLDKSVEENIRIAQCSGHSRFPVCRGTLDEVEGILLVREWLWQINALGPNTPFEPLIRPALVFDLRTPIHTMIERFRSSRSHLAVVFDDAKRFAGIVTFEDVLEEIVGDIRDEFDLGSGPIYEHVDQKIVVSGSLTVRELQAETGWSLEVRPRETVSSWVQRNLGSMPRRDNPVLIGDFLITALDVSGERIRRLRIERVPAEEEKQRRDSEEGA